MPKETKSQLIFFILFGLVPNLPLYILQLINYSDRPVINFDYIWAAVLFLFILKERLFLFALVFFVSFVLDSYFYVINMFHFNLEAALELLKDETFVNLDNIRDIFTSFLTLEQFILLSIALFIYVSAYFYLIKIFLRSKPKLSISYFILLYLLMFVANSHFIFKTQNKFLQELSEGMIYRSPITEYIESILYFKNLRPADFYKLDNYSTKEIRQEIDLGRTMNDKILLVMVESFGVFSDGDLQQALYRKAFSDLDKSKFYYRYSEIHSSYHTVQGEVRELCGLYVNKLHLKGNEEALEDCFPNILKKKGYKTYAIHNARQDTFNRVTWWPTAGFDNINFIEQIRVQYKNYRMCRDYIKGICDDFIATEVIPDILSGYDKQFIFWLTLDGHLPLDFYKLSESDIKECSSLKLKGQTCRYFQIHSRTLAAIAALAKDEKRMKDFSIYIIGDHPPPFSGKKGPDSIKNERVPFVKIGKNHED